MKQNTLFSILNSKINKSSGGGGSTVDTDYNHLENKPSINGVGLVGNKSIADLGIDIPTKQSLDLDNVDNTSDTNKPISDAAQAEFDSLNTDLTDLTSSVAVNLFNSTLKSLKEMNTSGTWSGNVYTKDGMTVTVNSDLSLKFVGKATASWGVYFYTKHIDLKIGNYTFSCLNSNNNIYGFLARPNAQTLNVKGSTSTFSVAEDITSNDIGIICNYNVDINTTVYPMIERGTVAHPYQPCIGADSIPKSISELNENLIALAARVAALEN